MSSTTNETKPWYADDAGEKDESGKETGWGAVCRTMGELAANDLLDGDEPVWEAFSRFVRSTALDQEVYGEYLLEGGAMNLGPMWMAYRCGWSARSGVEG